MTDKSIYVGGEISQEEIEYFKQVKYPQFVSESVLLGKCRDKMVVDVGAGPSTFLGEWITGPQDGLYIATDIHEQSLKLQREKGLQAAVEDISALSFDSASVDIAHERFVLMHLRDDEQRKKAISEMVRIVRNRAIFIEYDWSSFSGGLVVNGLRDFMLKVFPKHVDPYLGKILRRKVEDVLFQEYFPAYEIQQISFQRSQGVYYDELVPLVRSFHAVMRRLQTPFISEAKRFVEIIENEAKKPSPELFVPPTIVAVVVIK